MERDDRIFIRADARAMGAVTALSVRHSERWHTSGTKSGDCVSIFPDGSRVPFTSTKSRKFATPKVKSSAIDNRDRYFRMLEKYGAVSDTETN